MNDLPRDLQAFAAFDTGNLVEVPVDMPLPLAATLILDGPTVEHALFDPRKLDLSVKSVRGTYKKV